MATNSQLYFGFWPHATSPPEVCDKVHVYHAFQQIQINNAFSHRHQNLHGCWMNCHTVEIKELHIPQACNNLAEDLINHA